MSKNQKRVLVIGGAKKIGMSIINNMLNDGCIVYSVDKGPSLIDSSRLINLFCERKNNVELKNIISKYAFDIVVDADSKTAPESKKIYEIINKTNLQQFIYHNPHRFVNKTTV